VQRVGWGDTPAEVDVLGVGREVRVVGGEARRGAGAAVGAAVERDAGTVAQAEVRVVGRDVLIDRDGADVKLIYALPGDEAPVEFKAKEKQHLFVLRRDAPAPGR